MVFKNYIYIILSLISSHAYGYIYTVYNTTGRDMWIEVNISGQWQKQYMLNGQSYDFGFKDGWKKGLCLTEIKYKHEKAADDKKNNKDWKLVQFSLAKDLKKAPVGVVGAAGGFVGTLVGVEVGLGALYATASGSALTSSVQVATSEVVSMTVGAAAGAALGIGIAAGALALSALCRNITGSGGIFVYENNKGKVCWTFGKIEKKQ